MAVTEVRGEHIYLRPFKMDDKDIVLAAVNDLSTAKFTGNHETFFTMEQVEGYIQSNIEGEGRFAWIIASLDDTIVGEVVVNQMDEDNRSASIRIALFGEQYFGKGYGTEAMRLATGYSFEHANLHRLDLEVFDFNARALRVYEKVGFKLEGTRRDALLWEGEYYDAHIMSILETEWPPS